MEEFRAEFRVEVKSNIVGDPIYKVITPDGGVFKFDTAWGVRRLIRRYKRAERLQAQANGVQYDIERMV